MPDREIQSLIMQAGEIRSESLELRKAVEDFATLLRRGLLRATVQGLVMIVVGIMLAITFLGLLAQPWSCDATNLSHQQGSFHYKACSVIFPQTVPQVATIKRQAAAAKKTADNQTEILDERRKTNAFLASFQARVMCVLKLPSAARTDAAVTACIGANP